MVLCTAQAFGTDGDAATAAAMRALKDESKALRDEKAAKKAAFDAEYDVGELLLPLTWAPGLAGRAGEECRTIR